MTPDSADKAVYVCLIKKKYSPFHWFKLLKERRNEGLLHIARSASQSNQRLSGWHTSSNTQALVPAPNCNIAIKWNAFRRQENFGRFVGCQIPQTRSRRVLPTCEIASSVHSISGNDDTTRTVSTELYKALSMGTVFIPVYNILMSSPSRDSYMPCLHA